MTDLAAAVELLRAVDLDCMILAVFFNLLLHTGARELLPLCLEKGVPVLAAGPYGSGLLADPYVAQPRLGYRPAERKWIDKAQRIDGLCRQFGVPLKAAAMQFPLAYPAVVSIITGPANPRELEKNVQMSTSAISSELWVALKLNGLLPEELPTPS